MYIARIRTAASKTRALKFKDAFEELREVEERLEKLNEDDSAASRNKTRARKGMIDFLVLSVKIALKYAVFHFCKKKRKTYMKYVSVFDSQKFILILLNFVRNTHAFKVVSLNIFGIRRKSARNTFLCAYVS